MGGRGRFLAIGYCSRTICCCFPFCFLEIYEGDKAVMEGDNVVIPQRPQGKTLIFLPHIQNMGLFVVSPTPLIPLSRTEGVIDFRTDQTTPKLMLYPLSNTVFQF